MVKRKRSYKQTSIFKDKKCVICGAQATILRVSNGGWHNLCDNPKCSGASARKLGI